MAASMSDRKPSFFVQSTNFEPNGILRGAQLTVVGAYRALQNPALFTSEHYRQAALAVVAGIAISVLVAIPVSSCLPAIFRQDVCSDTDYANQTFLIRLSIRFVGLFADLEGSTWDEDVIDGIHYIEHHVLQVPFFLMSFMRYLSPAMDHMFVSTHLLSSFSDIERTPLMRHLQLLANIRTDGLSRLGRQNLRGQASGREPQWPASDVLP